MKTEPDSWRTRSVEDFLKTLYLLQQQHPSVTTNQLAHALHIAPASTTDMIQRLAGLAEANNSGEFSIPEPLVDYRRYRGVRLNAAGERVALSVLRRRRLIEQLLCRFFGYRWDELDDDADLLEHAVSVRLEQRIAALLGYPEFDPHGDPIPTETGDIPSEALVSLAALPVGQAAIIRRVDDQTPEVLRSLANLGLVLERAVRLRERNELNDTLTVELGTWQVETISLRVAQTIAVKRFPTYE